MFLFSEHIPVSKVTPKLPQNKFADFFEIQQTNIFLNDNQNPTNEYFFKYLSENFM